jgi:hypothetical protein
MPFATGTWGTQAKIRSKKRLQYFKEYQKKKYANKIKRPKMIRDPIILALPFWGHINYLEILNERSKKFHQKNPKIFQAQCFAKYHIKIPENQLCQKCNRYLAKVRHHPDHSKILEVQFLCTKCHAIENRDKKLMNLMVKTE